ncbi:MAG: enoyl-CoA hydratase/isomerase family protein [Lautropia sp.]
MLAIERHDGVTTLRIDRPAVRNALNAELLQAMIDAARSAIADPGCRVIVLAGNGKAFCAGADLNWMKAGASFGDDENRADSMRLATLLRTLAESPKPTIARVHGAAYAGGLGLVCACDIAVASSDARFCVSEVRIGLIPSMISPYLLRAIGPRAASRYFLSAEVFDAREAHRIGLVQQAVAADALDDAITALAAAIRLGGPQALAASKALVRDFHARPIDDTLIADTAARIAATRASAEGREGVAAFLEKRSPRWQRAE